MKFLRRRIPNPNPYPPLNPSPIAVVDTDISQLTGIVNGHTEAASSSSLPHQDALTDEINDDDSLHQTSTTPAATEGPPTDDCCPICFGGFVVPCRALCGHWYCGGCILEYWNHVSAFRLRPCKCPMCSRCITKLMPEPSLYQQEDVEVGAVLKNVQHYNRLFVGGIIGFLLKMLQFMKKVLHAMMDPDRPLDFITFRIYAMFLGALYSLFPFDFLPTGRLFDQSALVLALAYILYRVGLYLRRRHLQNVRQLAGVQP